MYCRMLHALLFTPRQPLWVLYNFFRTRYDVLKHAVPFEKHAVPFVKHAVPFVVVLVLFGSLPVWSLRGSSHPLPVSLPRFSPPTCYSFSSRCMHQALSSTGCNGSYPPHAFRLSVLTFDKNQSASTKISLLRSMYLVYVQAGPTIRHVKKSIRWS